jgi:hypothetical protein
LGLDIAQPYSAPANQINSLDFLQPFFQKLEHAPGIGGSDPPNFPKQPSNSSLVISCLSLNHSTTSLSVTLVHLAVPSFSKNPPNRRLRANVKKYYVALEKFGDSLDTGINWGTGLFGTQIPIQGSPKEEFSPLLDFGSFGDCITG